MANNVPEKMECSSENAISEVVSGIFREFELCKIPYCVLRGYENLPEKISHDIDILVLAKDVSEYLKIILEKGEKNGFMCFSVVKRYAYTGIHLWSGNNVHLLIDLFTKCHWRGVEYVCEDFVLNNRVKYKDFWVSSPGCEAAITLMKEVLTNGRVKDNDKAKQNIFEKFERGQSDFNKVLLDGIGGKATAFLEGKIKMKLWGDIEARFKWLRRCLLKRKLCNCFFKQIIAWASFLWWHLLHFLHRPMGMFIVLLGPDGSGKSAIADGLINGIADNDVFRGHAYYHTNVGLLPHLKYFTNILSKQADNVPSKKKGELAGMINPHPSWRSLLYLCYYSLDYALGLTKIYKQKRQNKLVIFDRYFYDFFYQRQNRKLPHWLLWFFHYFIPKANLIICLSADAETIHRRKPELSIEEIKQQCLRIEKLASRLKNTLTLDTSKNVDENVSRVENKIIESLTK